MILASGLVSAVGERKSISKSRFWAAGGAGRIIGTRVRLSTINACKKREVPRIGQKLRGRSFRREVFAGGVMANKSFSPGVCDKDDTQFDLL